MTNFEHIKNRPTIICGIPKSGTTLLLALLDNHPQLTVFPEEMGFFPNVYGQNNPAERFLRKSGFRNFHVVESISSPLDTRDYSDVNFASIEEAVHSLCSKTQNSKDLLTGAVGIWHAIQQAQSDEKIRWVEKTPHNERFLYLYDQWFHEEAIYLHLIRDPRDNFATYKRKHSDFTLHEFALRCALSGQIGFWAQKHLTNYHFIRYEDLVLDPERAMRRICEILGIRYTESLLHPTRNGKPWKGNSMYNTSFDGISSRSVGRYKDHLQEREIKFLEERLHAFMRVFDYDLCHDPLQHIPPEFGRKVRLEFLKWQFVFGYVFRYPKAYNMLRFFIGLTKNPSNSYEKKER